MHMFQMSFFGRDRREHNMSAYRRRCRSNISSVHSNDSGDLWHRFLYDSICQVSDILECSLPFNSNIKQIMIKQRNTEMHIIRNKMPLFCWRPRIWSAVYKYSKKFIWTISWTIECINESDNLLFLRQYHRGNRHGYTWFEIASKTAG